MIDGKKILAIIPARAGSKRVLNKNCKKLLGKPLIQWTFDAVTSSKYIDRAIVSSDDESILSLAMKSSLSFLKRADSLSTDYATSIDVVADVLASTEDFDYFILLQPTSPLRTTSDIDAALEFCFSKNAKSCVSLCEVTEVPFHMFYKNKAEIISPVVECSSQRTQDYPKVFKLNGAIYICEISGFQKQQKFVDSQTLGYVMPRSRSIDIDTEEDFEHAQSTLAMTKKN